jgi:hypothetical protein
MVQTAPIISNTAEMVIGKNKYIVTTHFKENGRETAKDKLLRYVSNRITADVKCSDNTEMSEK